MMDTLHSLMRKATRLTRAGRLIEATAVIQRALLGKGASASATSASTASPSRRNETPDATRAALAAPAFHWPPRAVAKAVGDAQSPATATTAPQLDGGWLGRRFVAPASGTFTEASYTHSSITRSYKLFCPPTQGDKKLPLVVMLHGCTQGPDDFAAGTDMNAHARQQGFYVLYPAQSRSANPSRCWNWFKHNHQQRGRGETAFIAALTQEVIKQHGIDAQRVYIAGMSAGGAMAATVAAAYPEIFAAVGVHSGVPHGAASDVSGALEVMRNGGAGVTVTGRRIFSTNKAQAPEPSRSVATIVFHGDGDKTVHPRNGEKVIDAIVAGRGDDGGAHVSDIKGATREVSIEVPKEETGMTPAGRRFTRTTYQATDGTTVAEYWVVHGGGHAWSGGKPEGSHTDPLGPDATREMLRFFFAQPVSRTRGTH